MHPVFNHHNRKFVTTRKDLVCPKSLPMCKRKEMMQLLQDEVVTDEMAIQQLQISRTCFYKYKPYFILGMLYLPADLEYRVFGRTHLNQKTKLIQQGGIIDNYLIRNLISDPSATIKKHQINLINDFGIFISFSTLYRWRIDHNLSYKKLTKQPKEANRMQCLQHIEIIREVVSNINQLAYFDESHCNQKLHNPTHGWAIKLPTLYLLFCNYHFVVLLFCCFVVLLFCCFVVLLFCCFVVLLFCNSHFIVLLFCCFAFANRGQRCHKNVWLARGNVSLTLMLTTDYRGPFCYQIVQGSNNTQVFMDYMNYWLIPSLGNYPNARSVLIMDNCRIHGIVEFVDLVNEHQFIVVKLPSYKPWWNLAEWNFNAIKMIVRSFRLTNTDALSQIEAVCNAVEAIKDKDWTKPLRITKVINQELLPH